MPSPPSPLPLVRERGEQKLLGHLDALEIASAHIFCPPLNVSHRWCARQVFNNPCRPQCPALLPQARIECITQSIADERKTEHNQGDHEGGQQPHMPVDADVR